MKSLILESVLSGRSDGCRVGATHQGKTPAIWVIGGFHPPYKTRFRPFWNRLLLALHPQGLDQPLGGGRRCPAPVLDLRFQASGQVLDFRIFSQGSLDVLVDQVPHPPHGLRPPTVLEEP